ncbi:hypothetical protein IE81DRAFT_344462 [Ceraceosorus guamensis]|uniref:Uncharacterized protein n=1 Tax=Ceraceosorus guamensis TaxID=1522189 RepID=A0A316W6K5_9BASI|nr:hypothetical protein IE81DRAFT_344462 [Ceraceosorus guamensis]PWN45556.1 hypothetical protein IE81DRAFT_344462 [Ceraceosorus guamensis]
MPASPAKRQCTPSDSCSGSNNHYTDVSSDASASSDEDQRNATSSRENGTGKGRDDQQDRRKSKHRSKSHRRQRHKSVRADDSDTNLSPREWTEKQNSLIMKWLLAKPQRAVYFVHKGRHGLARGDASRWGAALYGLCWGELDRNMRPNEALAVMNKHIDVMKGIAMRVDENLSISGRMYSVAGLREKADAAIAAKNKLLTLILERDLRIIFDKARTQAWLPGMLDLIREKRRGEHGLTLATFRTADAAVTPVASRPNPSSAVLSAVGGSAGAASELESAESASGAECASGASSRATSATPARAAATNFGDHDDYNGWIDDQEHDDDDALESDHAHDDALESDHAHDDTLESDQEHVPQASIPRAIAPQLPSTSGNRLSRSSSTAARTTGDDTLEERAHVSEMIQLMRETIQAQADYRKADEERREDDIAREALERRRDRESFAATMLQAVRMLPSQPGSSATPNDLINERASENERQEVERASEEERQEVERASENDRQEVERVSENDRQEVERASEEERQEVEGLLQVSAGPPKRSKRTPLSVEPSMRELRPRPESMGARR